MILAFINAVVFIGLIELGGDNMGWGFLIGLFLGVSEVLIGVHYKEGKKE